MLSKHFDSPEGPACGLDKKSAKEQAWLTGTRESAEVSLNAFKAFRTPGGPACGLDKKSALTGIRESAEVSLNAFKTFIPRAWASALTGIRATA